MPSIVPLTYITSIFRIITLKMESVPVAALVKEGVAYSIGGFTVTPMIGFFLIILIGLVFFGLCVYKFNKADFSNVKVVQHHH